jgi:hypothetical protein
VRVLRFAGVRRVWELVLCAGFLVFVAIFCVRIIAWST